MRLPQVAKSMQRFAGTAANAWDVADRAFALEAKGRDIIHLSIGDPDISTPAFICKAAVAAIGNGRTHYSAVVGEPGFRAAVCEHARSAYRKEIGPERVIVMPGAQPGLFGTFMAVTEPGDEVIVLEPSYITYDGVASANGASVVRVPLSADDHFALDTSRIKAAITGRTAAILLNSPGNPSGAVYSREGVRAVLALCREHGLWLVSDEVYGSLVFDGEQHSPFAEDGADDHVVVVNSLSKCFAMTGWRIGWVIAPEPVIAALGDLSQHAIFGVTQFVQDAAAVALREGEKAKAEISGLLRRRRDVLCDGLQGLPGLHIRKPAGGMFLLADVSGTGMDGSQFADALLEEVGIALVPGVAFGTSVSSFVRIGFLADEETLAEAVRRFATFLRGRVSSKEAK